MIITRSLALQHKDFQPWIASDNRGSLLGFFSICPSSKRVLGLGWKGVEKKKKKKGKEWGKKKKGKIKKNNGKKKMFDWTFKRSGGSISARSVSLHLIGPTNCRLLVGGVCPERPEAWCPMLSDDDFMG